jgi:uncharacterized protein (UPF0335 family)
MVTYPDIYAVELQLERVMEAIQKLEAEVEALRKELVEVASDAKP